MKSRIFWGATGLGLVALFVAFRFVDLGSMGGPDLCLFHRLSGRACPSCGMTRAVAALARGEWSKALRYHPLVPLVVAEIALLWILWGRSLWFGQAVPGRFLIALVWATAALFLFVWLIRAAGGWLPA